MSRTQQQRVRMQSIIKTITTSLAYSHQQGIKQILLYKFCRMAHLVTVLALALLAFLQTASCVCDEPQKSVFFSMRALANRDDLSQLYESLPQSSFNFTYTDASQTTYAVINLQYRLQYNKHYQREEYVDNKTIAVVQGPISVLASFNFTVRQDNETIERGIAYARSHLDYSPFRKQILVADGYVEWDPVDVQGLTFSALWVIEGTSYQLSVPSRDVFEKMLNNLLGDSQLNKKIQKEINWYYPQKLKAYLNSQKMLAITDIPYSYRNISLSLAHSLYNCTVTPRGLQVYFRFGLNSKPQANCSILPVFDEESFGGVQEIITFTSIKSIIVEGLSQGLFNVALDRSWEVPVFQLYMGDLANAAPFATNLTSLTPITIACQSNSVNTTISPFDEKSIYVELAESCAVSSEGTLIKVDFQLITIALLQAQSLALTVRFSKFQAKSIKFTAVDSRFEVENNEVGQMIVLSLLNGLISKQAFGSKFPILERKYPSLYLAQDYLVVFDHSQVYI